MKGFILGEYDVDSVFNRGELLDSAVRR